MDIIKSLVVLSFFISLTREDCLSYPKNMTVFDEKNTGLDMLIVGMFPMFQDNGKINPSSILLSEALKYHVLRVQKEIPELKTHISFSGLIYDTSCMRCTTAEILLEILLDATIPTQSSKIFTILTSTKNQQFLNTVNILQADGIPTMMTSTNNSQSYPAINEGYHIKYLQSKEDVNRADFITNLLRNLNSLSYITILNDMSYFGTHGRNLLEKKFKAKNICIAHKFHIPYDEKSYQKLTAQIKFDKKMLVFVVWSERPEQVIKFLTKLNGAGVKNKVWILSYEVNITKLSTGIVASNNIINVVQQNSMTVQEEFRKYYDNLKTSDNPWLSCYFNESSNHTDSITSLKQLNTPREITNTEQIIHRATKSIWAALKTLSSRLLQKEEMSGNRYLAMKTYKRIFTVFEFQTDYVLKLNMKVALVQNQSIILVPLTRKNAPNLRTVCDSSCLRGYEPLHINKLVTCCWDCVKCQPQFYKNTTGQNRCMKCPEGMSSDFNRTTCRLYTKIYRKADTLEMAIVLAYGTISTLLSLFFFAVFYRFRGTPIVRASDSIKTFIQLVSHTFLSVLLYTFAVRQSQIICSLQPFLIGFFMTITASITFIKTRKLLLIFQAKTRLSHHHITLTKVVAASTVIFLAAIQFTISFCLFLFIPHRHSHNLDYEAITDHLECNHQAQFIVQLIYIKSLSLLCLWQAFKARKLPENFNETKYIGVAVLVSEVFLLAYVLKTETNITTNASLLFCANILLTIIMYGRRVFIILFQPGKNTSTVFRNKIMNRIKHDVETRTATVTSDMTSGAF